MAVVTREVELRGVVTVKINELDVARLGGVGDGGDLREQARAVVLEDDRGGVVVRYDRVEVIVTIKVIQHHAHALGGVEVGLSVVDEGVVATVLRGAVEEINAVSGGVGDKDVEVVVTIEVTDRHSAAVDVAYSLTLGEVARAVVEPHEVLRLVSDEGVEVAVTIKVSELNVV